MNSNALSASVIASKEIVSAQLTDSRHDSLALFSDLTGEQKEQLAVDAWQVGLRAIANAHSQAREGRLQEVGTSLLADFEGQLRAHVESQQHTISEVLLKYFDPKEGQVSQRMSMFLADEGVLARQLERFLSPKNSVLSETLAKQVGETSALFKRLSPTDSEGIVKVLEAQIQRLLDENQNALEQALDPLAEGGAVARFLKSLREELKGADADREKQLATALAALDANDEKSLLSRLARETDRTRLALVQAVNPNAPDSPMAIIKHSLTKLITDHSQSQAELLRVQDERRERFEVEVREALTRMESRRNEEQTSPRGGLAFEDAVRQFVVASTRGVPCTVEGTGNTTGALTRNKKGDVVVRFSEESAFANAGIVFEAKHDSGYTTQQALTELDEARKNRDACAGVFVMAASHASDTFPRFARYGSSVLVVWDETDPSSDPFLQAAVLLGLALASRSQHDAEAGDINALRDMEARLETELKRLTSMEKHNGAIRKHSDEIADELRKAQKHLDKLMRDARETLLALNVELIDEAAERLTPIEGARTTQLQLSARQAATE